MNDVLAEIITIGDEILIGQIVDTNSAWMGRHLNEVGIKVKQITSVSDNEEHILKALNEAKQRAQIVLITGGLGPTKDDITKTTLCKYFAVGLRFDEGAYARVEQLFKARGREVTPIDRKQAEVPENAVVLDNAKGTAPGMWIEQEGCLYVSMPGVPYEMKHLMEMQVLPRLKEKYKTPSIIHRSILTQGIGESFLSEMIANWEDALPANMKLAYLPSAGMVRLRLSATGDNFNELYIAVNNRIEALLPVINEYVYGFENTSLEEVVGKLLKQRSFSLATAESCTGGYIAHLITSVPGSSAYYKGTLVTYSYELKTQELGVKPETLDKYGAVSEQTVIEMVQGVRRKLGVDCAIACSGIAGPDGGTEEKPVGTVWVAIVTPAGLFTKKLQLGDNRKRVIHETALHALNMLRRELVKV